MNGFALDGWALIGVLLAVAALALLLGAALGYFTASTDLDAEREKARQEGRDEARHLDIEELWPDRGQLFDQDAPTEAAKAIELRGDD